MITEAIAAASKWLFIVSIALVAVNCAFLQAGPAFASLVGAAIAFLVHRGCAAC